MSQLCQNSVIFFRWCRTLTDRGKFRKKQKRRKNYDSMFIHSRCIFTRVMQFKRSSAETETSEKKATITSKPCRLLSLSLSQKLPETFQILLSSQRHSQPQKPPQTYLHMQQLDRDVWPSEEKKSYKMLVVERLKKVGSLKSTEESSLRSLRKCIQAQNFCLAILKCPPEDEN